MILMLLYSHIKKELKAMKNCGFEVSCKISDDDWSFLDYCDKAVLMKFLSENPVIDISCIDVTADGGVEIAEKMRKDNSNTYIILLSDSSVSPVVYIRPSIMAGSLLLRPLTEQAVKKVFLEAISEYIKKFNNGTSQNFVIDNREGRQLIPYEQIIFFEARAKKIFVNTSGKEYSFYDTMDNLEQKLSDKFIRCHRSYIVARSRIKKILLSQNMIILDDDYCIPLSRTYKSVLKELK